MSIENPTPYEFLDIQKQLMGALDMLITSDFLDYVVENTGLTWREAKNKLSALVVIDEFREKYTLGLYIHKDAIKYFKI